MPLQKHVSITHTPNYLPVPTCPKLQANSLKNEFGPMFPIRYTVHAKGAVDLICSTQIESTSTTTHIPMAMLTTQQKKIAIAALEFYFWGNFVGVDNKQVVTMIFPAVTAEVLQQKLFSNASEKTAVASDDWPVSFTMASMTEGGAKLPQGILSFLEEKQVFVPKPSLSSEHHLKTMSQTANTVFGEEFVIYLATFQIEKIPMMVLKT